MAEEKSAGSGRVERAYYQDGKRWEEDIYRRAKASAQRAWFVAGTAGLIAAMLAVCLVLLIPLKSFEPYMVLVDKTTGYLEISRPVAQGSLHEDEAITTANLVRYVRARETYEPFQLKDNFELAQLLSTGDAARTLAESYAPSNPRSLTKELGRNSRVTVSIKSVSMLNNRTGSIRFSTTTLTERDTRTRDWVAIARFRYSGTPMRNEWRFDNPLGFQVEEYRRDQETVSPGPKVNPSAVDTVPDNTMSSPAQPGPLPPPNAEPVHGGATP